MSTGKCTIAEDGITLVAMLKRWWILLSVMLIPLGTRADRIEFEMSVFGIRFGTMVVTRTIENDSTVLYTLHAKGKTDFLFMKREEESKYQVRYRNGVLHSSDYTYLNRGKAEKWSRVSFENGHYRIETKDGSRIHREPIDYSLLKLYFEPDGKRQRVFCEEDCSFSSMSRDPASNAIRITCKDGSSSTYHLKGGAIHGLDIHLPVATVKLVRVN